MPKKGEIKNRTGEKHITNQGYEAEILEYKSSIDCLFRFNDKHQTTIRAIYKSAKQGWLKNPNHPSACGVGYMGQGIYTSEHRAHEYWYSVIRRCHNEYSLKRNPTYKEITVCEEWKCFQNFAEWFEENWKSYMDSSWHLDKDILVKGNKVYSPETCAFVPQEVNKLFTRRQNERGDLPIGVSIKNKGYEVDSNKFGESSYVGVYKTISEAFEAYKTAKESYIKEVADKWKNLIDPRVYQAMYNYKIEITD